MAKRKKSPPAAFRLTKRKYDQNFVPVYKLHDVEPSTLIQFTVFLPFHIPVIDGICTTLDIDSQSVCTFEFSTKATREKYDPGIADGTSSSRLPKSTPIYRSRVEMTYAVQEKLEMSDDDNFFPTFFNKLLERLNDVILSYLIITKDVDAYRLSARMFQPVCFWRFVHPDEWDNAQEGLYFLHVDMPYERDPLPGEQLEEIARLAMVRTLHLNPFLLSEEMMLSSRRYLKEGFDLEATLYAQISVETFLNILLAELLIVEGKTQEEAEQYRERLNFKTMIKNEFHKRLGGHWNTDDEKTAVGTWWRDTYLLRNRTIHAGYRPNYAEAWTALEAADSFRKYVITLINAKGKKYKAISQYFMLSPESKA